MSFVLLLLISLVALVSCATIEWYGVFELPENSTLLLQKVDGEYAEKTLLVSYHACDTLDADCISTSKSSIDTVWEGTPEQIKLDETQGAGGPLEPGKLYNLHMAQSTFTSMAHLVPAKAGPHVIAMQHFPIEFEDFRHYLANAAGDDLEPAAEEGGAAEEPDSNHTLEAFGANVVITLATLVGLVTLAPCFNKLQTAHFQAFTSAFSTGALLGASAFLILPESLLLIRTGYEAEATSNAVYGSCVCVGFFIGALSHILAESFMESSGEVEPKKITVAEEGAILDIKSPVEIQPEEKAGCCEFRKWKPVVWSVLCGDALHNIADGVAVAVAFKLCNSAVGWVVALGAILHEVPTELGDFLILTGQGNMKPAAALGFNLLSGVTCVVGGLIASSIEMDDVTVGAILGISGGMYIWVCVEVFNMALKVRGRQDSIVVLLLFCAGCLCIGLVLFAHEHCAVGHGH